MRVAQVYSVHTHVCAHNHRHIRTYSRHHQLIPVATIPVHPMGVPCVSPFRVCPSSFSLKILVLSNHLNAPVHLPRPVIHAPKGLGFALRVSLLNLSLEFICRLNSSNCSYLMSK